MWRYTFFVGLLCVTLIPSVNAGAHHNCYPSRFCAPSLQPYNSQARLARRSRLHTQVLETESSPAVILAGRTSGHYNSWKRQNTRGRRVGFARRVLRGTIYLTKAVVREYIVGFSLGYAGGTLVGIPALILDPVKPQLASKTLSKEIQDRLLRMNTASCKLAFYLGGTVATFKGCETLIKILRYPNHDDKWNEVLGCAGAGALFARTSGPVAMAKGAVIWGTLSYFLIMRVGRRQADYSYVDHSLEHRVDAFGIIKV